MTEKDELREEYFSEFEHRDMCLFELHERYNENYGKNSCTCGLERQFNFMLTKIEEAVKRERTEARMSEIEAFEDLFKAKKGVVYSTQLETLIQQRKELTNFLNGQKE